METSLLLQDYTSPSLISIYIHMFCFGLCDGFISQCPNYFSSDVHFKILSDSKPEISSEY